MPLSFTPERFLNAGAIMFGDEDQAAAAQANIADINKREYEDAVRGQEEEIEARKFARQTKQSLLLKSIEAANDESKTQEARQAAAQNVQKLSQNLGIEIPELESIGRMSKGDYELAGKIMEARAKATEDSWKKFSDPNSPNYGDPKILEEKGYDDEQLKEAQKQMFKDADPESIREFVKTRDPSVLTWNRSNATSKVNRFQTKELADGTMGIFDTTDGSFRTTGMLFRQTGKNATDPVTGLPVADSDKGSKLIAERRALQKALEKNPDDKDIRDRLSIVSSKIDKEMGVSDEEYSAKVSLARNLISDLRKAIEVGDKGTKGLGSGEGVGGKFLRAMIGAIPGDFSKDVTGLSGAVKKYGAVLRQFGIEVGTTVEEMDRKFKTLQLSVTEELLNEKKVTDAERATIRELVGNISLMKDDKALLTSLKNLEDSLNAIERRSGADLEAAGIRPDGLPVIPKDFKPPDGEDWSGMSNDDIWELIQGEIQDGVRDPKTYKLKK